jgi:hypothetical protein
MVSKPLSKERMGEIALKVLKYRLEREGIKLTPNFRREVNSTAKAIGVDPEEMMTFAEYLTREAVESVFSPKNEATR